MTKHNEDVPCVIIERKPLGIKPLMVGLLAGACVSMLFAPYSGPETRRRIRDKANRVRTAAKTATLEKRAELLRRIAKGKARVRAIV